MGSSVCVAFGQNLRSIRKSKGFSQERLAHDAGIDRSYVGKIERGQANITLEKLYIFAEMLECSPKDLIPEINEG
ncbi:helix-turn-helix domain-containing protein [Marinobacter shengliensis]|uniref:helix-turn-helix domain-containing protein n=1 Tax=Marinobacter shengliensis TaxID=1389223 RepID=UPI0035B7BD88